VAALFLAEKSASSPVFLAGCWCHYTNTSMHLHICDIVAHRVEMLGHRKSRSVLAYALQILTKLNSEASPGFTDVEMGASAAGYAVHEIFRHTCKMFLDGKDAFRTWFLGETIDVLPGVPTRAFTCT